MWPVIKKWFEVGLNVKLYTLCLIKQWLFFIVTMHMHAGSHFFYCLWSHEKKIFSGGSLQPWVDFNSPSFFPGFTFTFSLWERFSTWVRPSNKVCGFCSGWANLHGLASPDLHMNTKESLVCYWCDWGQ